MTVSTMSAAKLICQLSDWQVTPLKLQKILYLAHMVYMGKSYGEPLIKDLFVAGDYGLIVPALYYAVKHYGDKSIRAGFYAVSDVVPDSKEGREIKMAVDYLLSQSSGRLVALTQRKGGAWEQHYLPGAPERLIPNKAILAEYNVIFNRSR